MPTNSNTLLQLPTAMFLAAVLFVSVGSSNCVAQNLNETSFEIGTPTLTELWVDPSSGSDSANGRSRSSAFRTVTAAWNSIPQNAALSSTGYRINLLPGVYAVSALPNYWENRVGTHEYPIILQAVDGRGTVVFRGGPNVFGSSYVYFINIDLIPAPAGDAFHCEQCDHILLRGLEVDGGSNQEAHETIKFNQSQYVYIEDSNIHGAYDNAIDFVAVQYGHIVRNLIHDAGDWCAYVKGGSSYLRVEGNRFYDCGTGGFTAGQGTGFEFMTTPWLHYEAYNIKVFNNVVHDTEGAGLGVNGGYNILLAHNTLYRVGSRSHAIEVVFGLRGCDGNTSACAARLSSGGWGTTVGAVEEPIPNRNVYVYNNVVYNPADFNPGDQHFAIYASRSTGGSSNIPSPARADTNVQIKGNVIWNGPVSHPLGVGDGEGCEDSNPECNQAQLLSENTINQIEPQLRNPAAQDFRPAVGSNLFSATTVAVPNFAGGDLPTSPAAPQGTLSNAVTRDRSGQLRPDSTPAGAYATANASTPEPVDPVPVDQAPTVSSASCTPRKIRAGKTVSCVARVSDDGAVRKVLITFNGRNRVSMKRKNGAYRATWKVKKNSRKSWTTLVTATDNANQSSHRSAGRIKLK